MSTLNNFIKEQRNLDNHFSNSKYDQILPLKSQQPSKGWIRTIRETLGMTAEQLGKRVHAAPNRKTNNDGEQGISGNSILVLERNEMKGSITLESLERVADGLNCDFVYALVPRASLQEMSENQINLKLDKVIHQTQKTMALEDQSAEEIIINRYFLADELAKKSAIWD